MNFIQFIDFYAKFMHIIEKECFSTLFFQFSDKPNYGLNTF